MKIGIITGYPPNKGRGAELMSYFVNELSKFQDISKIIVIGNIAKNVPIKEIHNKITIIRVWSPNSWTHLLKTLKVVSQQKIDILHINYGYAFPGKPFFSALFIFSILFIAKCMRKPVIVTINQVFPLNEIKDLKEMHPTKMPSFFIKVGLIILNKLIALFSCKIVAIHKEHVRILKNIYQIDNIEYIPLPAPVNTTMKHIPKTKAKRLLNLKNKKVLLVFGFIVPYKGVEYAIKAMPIILNKISDVILIIAGSPPPSLAFSDKIKVYIEKIKYLIKELGIEKYVIFRNKYIPEDEVILLFKASDIIIIPNTKQTGPSEVLRKALIFNIPVIATNTKYNKYDIVNNFTGILIPLKDYKKLAKAIIELLLDNKKYAKICQNIRNISYYYAPERIVSKYINLYKRCSGHEDNNIY